MVDLPFDNVDYVASLNLSKSYEPRLFRSYLDVVDNKAFGFDEGYYQIGFDDSSIYGYYNSSNFDEMDTELRNQMLREEYSHFPDDIRERFGYVFNPNRIRALVYFLMEYDVPMSRG